MTHFKYTFIFPKVKYPFNVYGGYGLLLNTNDCMLPNFFFFLVIRGFLISGNIYYNNSMLLLIYISEKKENL